MNASDTAVLHTFDTPRPILLRVDQVSGRLEVEATGQGSTEVRIVPLNPDADGAADYVALARVDLDGETVRVQLPHAHPRRRQHPQVLTRVVVPAGSDVDLRSGVTTMTTDGPLGDVS
ncbi:MAG TPA: hypothetical protein VIJ71_06690, partial [Mycobacteriales bacterium]